MSEQETSSEPTASGTPAAVPSDGPSDGPRTRRIPVQQTAPAAAADTPAVAPTAAPAPAPAPAPGGPMEEADRHGFISAFIGGVRPEGDQARSGKRLLAIGATVAVVAGLGALVVGALASGDGKASAAVQPSAHPAAPTHPAGAAPSLVAAPPITPVPPGGVPQPAAAPVAVGGALPLGGQPGQPVTVPNAQAAAPQGAPAAAPANQPAAMPAAPQALAAKPGYTAVAGPGCNGGTFYTKDADYTLGIGGWLTSSDGGYKGEGCNGSYDSEPMSGDANKYDASQGVLWRWDFSKSFTSATCAFSIYVPDNSDITYVGGDPTQYFFWGANYAYGMNFTPQGTFNMSQVDNRGRWVNQGAFNVSTGIVTLKMVNTGIDYTSSTKHAHHAAAPVRLSCTAA
ncbi:hypothetical protein P3T36_000225 [Kitasatospora sp. MAP12-15]|uniref:hypothetical protein n=1 Tax=unclassified Kitasatospora TaxID=2633591 RepID=UPI0024760F23|nr:hypothetical protein [Kitasatospora sp. MAP12-44]MDH6109454.1 hypothetical protein [Kitasatospora sp. MAP12-44]